MHVSNTRFIALPPRPEDIPKYINIKHDVIQIAVFNYLSLIFKLVFGCELAAPLRLQTWHNMQGKSPFYRH